ncbi:type II toxin-antitoxin system RelE family toxin [Sphingomonas sp. CJ99]
MWQVEFSRRAEKQIAGIDAVARTRILKKLAVVAQSDDPRATAEPLTGGWTGYWRFRVGDYRVIAEIEDETVTVFVIEVGHRREVYR